MADVPAIALSTIQQLDDWLTAHCFTDKYGIGNRQIDEGCGLEAWGSLYIWYYTERGERQHLQYFDSEKEAVAFAYKTITADHFADSHLVGFIQHQQSVQELEAELQKRGIDSWKDDIPYYGPERPVTRVFVRGCDIKKVQDLQNRYGKV